MKKRNLIKTLIASLMISSCNLLDDYKPLDYISDAQLWNDPALIDGYLRQCYSELTFYNECSPGVTLTNYTNMQTNPTVFADEALNISKATWLNFLFWNDAYPWWGYETIRKLNIFIERLKDSPIADELKVPREGEARFLRAFAYFNMVKRYGGVPLILKSLSLENSTEEELFPKRAKEEEIYQFIIDEVDWITENNVLPKKYDASDLGRPTRYAALALKSRAALYAGSIAKYTTEKGLNDLIKPSGVVGIPADKATYFYEESFKASDEIIRESGHALFKKYNDGTKEGYIKTYRQLFMEEDNEEVIFSERFDGVDGRAHSRDMWECPMGYDGWSKGQMSCVYPAFVDAYENMNGNDRTLDSFDDNQEYTIKQILGDKDPRFAASIYTEGDYYEDPLLPNTLHYYKQLILPNGDILSEGYHEGFSVVGFCAAQIDGWRRVETPFGVLKYLDNTANAYYARSDMGRSNTDFIVFRLGEIYLNRAEAAYELKKGNPLGDINEIRSRVGMPNLSADELNIETIQRERQVELAFEGPRFFDIRRWRVGDKFLGINPYTITLQLVYQSVLDGGEYRYKIKKSLLWDESIDRTFYYKYYYNPITKGRTDINPNLEENPGWVY